MLRSVRSWMSWIRLPSSTWRLTCRKCRMIWTRRWRLRLETLTRSTESISKRFLTSLNNVNNWTRTLKLWNKIAWTWDCKSKSNWWRFPKRTFSSKRSTDKTMPKRLRWGSKWPCWRKDLGSCRERLPLPIWKTSLSSLSWAVSRNSGKIGQLRRPMLS